MERNLEQSKNLLPYFSAVGEMFPGVSKERDASTDDAHTYLLANSVAHHATTHLTITSGRTPVFFRTLLRGHDGGSWQDAKLIAVAHSGAFLENRIVIERVMMTARDMPSRVVEGENLAEYRLLYTSRQESLALSAIMSVQGGVSDASKAYWWGNDYGFPKLSGEHESDERVVDQLWERAVRGVVVGRKDMELINPYRLYKRMLDLRRVGRLDWDEIVRFPLVVARRYSD